MYLFSITGGWVDNQGTYISDHKFVTKKIVKELHEIAWTVNPIILNVNFSPIED